MDVDSSENDSSSEGPSDLNLFPATTDRNYQINAVRGTALSNKFIIEDCLYQGGFSRILLCTEIRTKFQRAVKVMTAAPEHREWAKNEIYFLRKLKHTEAKIRSLFVNPVSHFNHSNHVCLVLPVYGRNLKQFLIDNNRRGFRLEQCKQMCFKLITAFEFLHSNNLAHADVKPDNILLKYDRYHTKKDRYGEYQVLLDISIVVCDFTSIYNTQEPSSALIQLEAYRAPEVVYEFSWGAPADIWGLGCIFFEIMSGYVLFDIEHCASDPEDNQRKMTLNTMYTFMGPSPYWMANETERPSFDEFIPHIISMDYDHKRIKPPIGFISWSKDYRRMKKIIAAMLTLDPYARITSRELYDIGFLRGD